MNIIDKADDRTQKIWQAFITRELLTKQQCNKFLQYLELLEAWSEHINLTAITAVHQIITYHFQDSLQLGHMYDMNMVQVLVDVGSGAGFPGIPLKIRYPHLTVILIEVNQKKIAFLHEVIKILELELIRVYTHDWRTFIRTTHNPVDLICARASLSPEELLRMFKPTSPYQCAKLVYWASKQWEPTEQERAFMYDEQWYTVGYKRRKLIFFKLPE